jgi:hypothetical protein
LIGAAISGYMFGTIPSADIAVPAASGVTVDLRAVWKREPGGLKSMRVFGRGDQPPPPDQRG